jgi:hypothetical protein
MGGGRHDDGLDDIEHEAHCAECDQPTGELDEGVGPVYCSWCNQWR